MKKRTIKLIPACALILSIAAGLLLSACAVEEKEPVLPPIRMSENPARGSVVGPIGSPSELIEGSDAIACVRIGDWLGDTGDTITTMFEAEVTEVIKGELPKKITLLQEGASDFTFEGHPLFTAGNELLVFLTKCRNFPDARYTLPDNAYVTAGAYITVFDIVTLESGERYAVPRHRAAAYIVPPSVRNLENDRLLIKEVFKELKLSDNIWEKLNRNEGRFYSLDEFISAIKHRL